MNMQISAFAETVADLCAKPGAVGQLLQGEAGGIRYLLSTMPDAQRQRLLIIVSPHTVAAELKPVFWEHLLRGVWLLRMNADGYSALLLPECGECIALRLSEDRTHKNNIARCAATALRCLENAVQLTMQAGPTAQEQPDTAPTGWLAV